MKNHLFIPWPQLRRNHPPELVGILKEDYVRGGYLCYTDANLAARTVDSTEQARRLLEEFAWNNWLIERTVRLCPVCSCELTESDIGEGLCPHCGADYRDQGGVRTERRFEADLPQPRDVDWVLALHGMNTRGAWQEDFNWLVSLAYGRMVPVAVYKYGLVRPGVFLKFRQRMLMRRLVARIRRLGGDTAEGGFGSVPDVIAHSFGTWLLAHALKEAKDLRVGRVILIGSILRPNFDWAELIARGQVEAVLNHYGTRDFWAGVAQYFIPDSGPSGRRGFDRGSVLNLPARGFGHCDFFRERELKDLFRDHWQPFLRQPPVELNRLPGLADPPSCWRPPGRLLRATLPRYLLLLIGVAFAAFIGASLLAGFAGVGRIVARWCGINSS